MKKYYPLSEIEKPLIEAIERLLAQPKWKLPVVVVLLTHDTNPINGQATCVQFAGSNEEELLLDVPAIRLTKRCGGVAPKSVAQQATSILQNNFHVKNHWLLEIREFTQNGNSN